MFVSRFETTHGETWFSVRMRPIQVYRTSNLLSEFNSVRIYSRRTFLRNVIDDSLSFNNSKYYSRYDRCSSFGTRSHINHDIVRDCGKIRGIFDYQLSFHGLDLGFSTPGWILHNRVWNFPLQSAFSWNFRIPSAFTRTMARIFDS